MLLQLLPGATSCTRGMQAVTCKLKKGLIVRELLTHITLTYRQ
jgi:hypothetical protein